MNGYNFTDRVRKVLRMAREEAARLCHELVGTEHILLGLIREGEGVAAAVLTNLKVDFEEIVQKIEKTAKQGKRAPAEGPDLPYASRAKMVLELAMSEARELDHRYVGTEHLLLGLLREKKGIAAQVLTDAGVNLEQARAETLRLLGGEMPPRDTMPWSEMITVESIAKTIRDIPDFPKPGIVFKDITPLLLDPASFGRAIELMAAPFQWAKVGRVVSIESRGFLLGAPIALALDAGLVPIRKPGKLPAARGRVEYALEYGTDALEMHQDAMGKGDRVLIVDDVLATGGTAEAAAKLVRSVGAEVVGFTFLIELDFLKGRARLANERVEALIHYT